MYMDLQIQHLLWIGIVAHILRNRAIAGTTVKLAVGRTFPSHKPRGGFVEFYTLCKVSRSHSMMAAATLCESNENYLSYFFLGGESI